MKVKSQKIDPIQMLQKNLLSMVQKDFIQKF